MRINWQVTFFTWLTGAAWYSLVAVICGHFFSHQQEFTAFVLLGIGSLVALVLMKWLGFLFLPVLVGGFLFMGNWSNYFWERESEKFYRKVDLNCVDCNSGSGGIALYRFSENLRPDFAKMVHLAEYDNLDSLGNGHGMLLSDLYFIPVRDQQRPESRTRYICKIEVRDGSLSLEDVRNQISSDLAGLAVETGVSKADSIGLRLFRKTYPGISDPEARLVRWGDPGTEKLRLWRKARNAFLISHLAWLILLAIQVYEPRKAGVAQE